mmetsp:Transcript_70558/g.147779  ORF Transcript_70558/g.147779 Transcript_70558/m.147779 type:complete len:202 (+) Transcript_70558:696-1301(+)
MHQRNLFPKRSCIFDISGSAEAEVEEEEAFEGCDCSTRPGGGPAELLSEVVRPCCIAWCSSALGSPNFSGESLITKKASKPTAIAMIPGARIPHCQPYFAETVPAMKGMRNPPIVVEEFHVLHHLPRVTVGYQFTNIFPQGVPPHPWNKPFAIHQKVNHGMELPMVNPMLHRPVKIIPRANNSTGDPSKSDRTPAMNLEFM